MKQLLLNIILTLADMLGFNYYFRNRNRNKVRILMYHGITNRTYNNIYWTQLPLEKFEKQVDYIQKKYNVLRPSKLLDETVDGESSVVITFDDGLQNVLYNALPVLKKNDLSAICFILPELSAKKEPIWPDKLYDIFTTTSEDSIDLSSFGLGIVRFDKDRSKQSKIISGLLKERPHLEREIVLKHIYGELAPEYKITNEDFALMSNDQIGELVNSGHFEIGPHTNRHPILSTMTKEEQDEEISGSITRVAQWHSGESMIFAYPNGREIDYNETSKAILESSGIRLAMSTIDGMHCEGDDRYSVKRIPIGADIGMAEFKARLSGLFYTLQEVMGK